MDRGALAPARVAAPAGAPAEPARQGACASSPDTRWTSPPGASSPGRKTSCSAVRSPSPSSATTPRHGRSARIHPRVTAGATPTTSASGSSAAASSISQGDGRELEFHTHELPGRSMVRDGQELFYPIDRLTLRCSGQGASWTIRSADGLVREFETRRRREPASTSPIARIVDRHGHSKFASCTAAGISSASRRAKAAPSASSTADGRLDAHLRAGGPGRRLVRPATLSGTRPHGDLVACPRLGGPPEDLRRTTTTCSSARRDRDGLTFWFEYDGRDSTARCVRTWGRRRHHDRPPHVPRHHLRHRAARRTFVEDSLGNTTIVRR